MSDMNNNRKEPEVHSDQELTAEDLTAALNLELSGLDAGEEVSEEEKKEIPAEEEVSEEEKKVIPAEEPEKTPEEEAVSEGETEKAPAEEAASEEQDAETETPEEEAFDEEDADIVDVSRGVAAIEDTPTEELPEIPAAVPVREETEIDQKSQKAQIKEEKKRLKQEAAEEKAREKQEAKERKRQEKAKKKSEKKAGRKKGPFGIILFLLLLLAAAAAIVYMALSNRYKTVFFDGTRINGADCTGLTVSEAETVIARQMDEYALTLIFRDGKKEEIPSEAIDFAYVPDGSVQEIKDSQIPLKWLTAFFREYTYEATAAASFDTIKLSQAVTNLEESNIVNMVAPADASLAYNEETKQLEIIPETQGTKFDLSALIEAAAGAASQGIRELNVEELGIYEAPARTSEDESLISQRDEMNGVLSSEITYTLPTGNTLVLDANILVNWISQDEAGNYYIDPENWGTNIANFVEDVAQMVNTSDTTAQFYTHNGGTVTLDNYLKGWLVDEEAEGVQLTQELSEHATVTREPIYSQRAYSDTNNGIGDTYVEIDLSAQYLWVYDSGEVIIESPVVSGTMVAETYTPEGIYPLYGKQEGRVLRGEQYADGSYEYASWVDYWMPFNGGIGMHDASWRTEFGGSTYIGAGSHGCVNMPAGKAAAVFEWITAGTPVVCYYSAGYTLAG